MPACAAAGATLEGHSGRRTHGSTLAIAHGKRRAPGGYRIDMVAGETFERCSRRTARRIGSFSTPIDTLLGLPAAVVGSRMRRERSPWGVTAESFVKRHSWQ